MPVLSSPKTPLVNAPAKFFFLRRLPQQRRAAIPQAPLQPGLPPLEGPGDRGPVHPQGLGNLLHGHALAIVKGQHLALALGDLLLQGLGQAPAGLGQLRLVLQGKLAGIHRLLAHEEQLRGARCIVAVAGMEGALPSVIGGLVSCPVIAVPTSVGYGASFGGVTALLAMLNSCASGVSVVNIDNGFGAGYQASLINHLR